MKIKLGEKIKFNQRFVRQNSTGKYGKTRCFWKLIDIPETEGIITGVRNISNGEMGDEGFIFEETRKVLKVAVNLKSEMYIPIKI
jgi:hypothetical protein